MASIVYDRSQSLPNFTATKEDYRSLNNSTNTPDDFECLKVEIVESDNSMAHPTTVSLIRCKKQIIHPFRKILCLISWRPFGADSYRRSSIPFRILNIIYPLFIFVLLLFNYIYEILVCQGSLSTVIVPVTTSAPMYSTTPGPNTTNMSLYLPSQRIQQRNETECGHVFTVYMIPDILHCAAFIIGFLYFRITEGEPMYSLIEKVFINADRNIRLCSPNRVIRRLKIFLLIGCIWVLASVTVHALSVVISDFNHHGVFENHNDSDSMGYSLFIVDIICLLVKNCIHLAVVMNFVSHCELIVFYCKAIRTRLEEKSVQLLEAMKQILDLKSSITQLNSAVSRMMSLLIVYFIDRLIVGLVILVRDDYTQTLTIIYRVLYPLIWLPILMFSIGMAARVTSKCDKFQQITHSMRVYGYHTATPSELDGFLLFVSVAELRVKLFGLAVRPGIVISTVVTTLLVCVVLIQTDIIDNKYVSI